MRWDMDAEAERALSISTWKVPAGCENISRNRGNAVNQTSPRSSPDQGMGNHQILGVSLSPSHSSAYAQPAHLVTKDTISYPGVGFYYVRLPSLVFKACGLLTLTSTTFKPVKDRVGSIVAGMLLVFFMVTDLHSRIS